MSNIEDLMKLISERLSDPIFRDNLRKLIDPEAADDLRCRNQSIRSVDNGYIVTLNTYGTGGNNIIVEQIFEINSDDDDSLEHALSVIVHEIGKGDDGDRVVSKLFPPEKPDEEEV